MGGSRLCGGLDHDDAGIGDPRAGLYVYVYVNYECIDKAKKYLVMDNNM